MGKVETLRSLVEEYVQYLDLWEKVTVEEITKDTLYRVNTVLDTDSYGIESTGMSYEGIEAKNTPHIRVTYYSPREKWVGILHKNGFESREFPLHDIDRRITHYRNKLYNLKKKADEQN